MRKADMAWIAVGMAAAAAPSAGARAQQPAHTVQQDFDAATALSEQPGQNAAALAAWQALEGRTKAGSRSRAIVEVRKGGALFKLRRYDEAVEAIRAGLAALPATDASLGEDRAVAQMMLGAVAMDNLDFAGAAAFYAAAEQTASEPATKLGAMLPQVKALTFVDPKAAAAAYARTEALVATLKVDKGVMVRLGQAQAELLLNTRDFAGAKAAAVRAVNAAGGLSSRTDLTDVSVRSDAAIALLLAGNADSAREYMAMTGAGRLPKGSFDPATRMLAPDCGGEAELKPADVAVVEFSILPDGTTALISPVYAAGGGRVALEFARAVKQWWWPAEEVKAIPDFFRYNVRIEMRCSNAFPRPSIGDTLGAAFERWLTDQHAALPDEAEGPAAIAGQRATLAAADRTAPGSLATLAALYRLAGNWALPDDERGTLYVRAAALAAAHKAPPTARLAVDMPAHSFALVGSSGSNRWEATLRELLADPVYAGDPQARGALRLMLADQARSRHSLDRETAFLRQVADDAALPHDDAMRVGALVRIASIEQRRGNGEAARGAFAATGLDASQCALLDSPPHLMSAGGVFPEEALRWGFEGWTRTEFDVSATGKVVGERAILSYPAFVFTQAGVATMHGARYSKSYRPDGGLGCGAMNQVVRFMLPG